MSNEPRQASASTPDRTYSHSHPNVLSARQTAPTMSSHTCSELGDLTSDPANPPRLSSTSTTPSSNGHVADNGTPAGRVATNPISELPNSPGPAIHPLRLAAVHERVWSDVPAGNSTGTPGNEMPRPPARAHPQLAGARSTPGPAMAMRHHPQEGPVPYRRRPQLDLHSKHVLGPLNPVTVARGASLATGPATARATVAGTQ